MPKSITGENYFGTNGEYSSGTDNPIHRELGEVLKRLAEQRESSIEEGHLMSDHVHMMISIPPKYAVSQVIGYIKGKSASFPSRDDPLNLD